MMFMIPLAMIATLIVSMVAGLSADPPRLSHADAIGENMLIQHEAAIEQMITSGMSSGSMGLMVAPPFAPMGEWRSRVVPSGDRRMVVTWSEGDGHDAARLAEATGYVNGKMTRRNILSHAGPYINKGSVAEVGGAEIHGFTFPVSSGKHVVVSVFEGD